MKTDKTFERRLNRHHDELHWLYMELYQNDAMFVCVLSGKKSTVKNAGQKKGSRPGMVPKEGHAGNDALY